jgi:hypothetical protein
MLVGPGPRALHLSQHGPRLFARIAASGRSADAAVVTDRPAIASVATSGTGVNVRPSGDSHPSACNPTFHAPQDSAVRRGHHSRGLGYPGWSPPGAHGRVDRIRVHRHRRSCRRRHDQVESTLAFGFRVEIDLASETEESRIQAKRVLEERPSVVWGVIADTTHVPRFLADDEVERRIASRT